MINSLKQRAIKNTGKVLQVQDEGDGLTSIAIGNVDRPISWRPGHSIGLDEGITWVQEIADSGSPNSAEQEDDQLMKAATGSLLASPTVIACGEKELLRHLRTKLISRGVAKKHLHTQAHWTPGRTGM